MKQRPDDKLSAAAAACQTVKRSASAAMIGETPVHERIRKALRHKFAAIHALSETPGGSGNNDDEDGVRSEWWSTPWKPETSTTAAPAANSPGRLMNISLDTILPISESVSPTASELSMDNFGEPFQSVINHAAEEDVLMITNDNSPKIQE
jgi:hypothetical protein